MTHRANFRYLVFVDFDGVLASSRVHFSHPKDAYPIWSTFDPVAIEFFNKIHNTYKDVGFVWTTTWRNHVPLKAGHIEHILYSMWYNAGFRGHFADPWKVNPYDKMDGDLNHADRVGEVLDYLENHNPDCEDFLVFDDSDYGWKNRLPRKRWVKTDPHDGILFKHMRKAEDLMGGWEKK